ncbi:MAG: AMP-binding protein, partial [Planctomycetes bacterium]|nr:AMP-binding protein [Planctomycetota bacterium]
MTTQGSHASATVEAPLGPEERHRVLVLWNLTEAPFPRHRSLGDVLLEVMTAHADQPALLDPDEPDGDPDGDDVTHGALARRGLQAAAMLRALGAGPGRVVAVAAAHPARAAEGLLGALWAGAAVAPLDPACPPEGLARALAILSPAVVVSDPEGRARLPGTLSRSLWLEGLPPPPDDAPLEPLAPGPAATEPAFALLAPGAAAAVVSSHRAAVNLL